MRAVLEVPRETVQAALANNLTGEAAKVAFYFFLSFFPLILVLLALTGLIGGDAAFAWIMRRLELALPEDAERHLEEFVREVALEQRPGILSLGILLLLWSASNIFAALADGLNSMYGITEARSWWRKRLVAIGLLVVGAIGLIGGAVALVAGPEIIQALGLGVIWELLRWPMTFLLVAVLLFLVYFVLPNRDQRAVKTPVAIGALIGTALWILATVAFRLYVANFDAYAGTYGVIGGIIMLLMWMFLSALAILLGGQAAAVLEERRGRLYGKRIRPAAS
jgi:membrane protein